MLISCVISHLTVVYWFRHCFIFRNENLNICWLNKLHIILCSNMTDFSCLLKDAFAKGEVFLGNGDLGYLAFAGLPSGIHCNGNWQYGITIKTPERCFLFTCETEGDQQDWLKHFNDVMSATMSPQEYTSKNSEFSHSYLFVISGFIYPSIDSFVHYCPFGLYFKLIWI